MGGGYFTHNSKGYMTNISTHQITIDLIKRGFNVLMIDEVCTSVVCSTCHRANNTFAQSNEDASKEAQRQFYFFFKFKLVQNDY